MAFLKSWIAVSEEITHYRAAGSVGRGQTSKQSCPFCSISNSCWLVCVDLTFVGNAMKKIQIYRIFFKKAVILNILLFKHSIKALIFNFSYSN